MKLALLSLVGLGLLAQNTAVYNNYSSTVKGVTFGTTHCTFWFHASVALPYDSEAACYVDGKLALVEASLPGVTTIQSFDFPGGSVTWQFKPNAGDATKIDYQITGLPGTILETGTL